jgi:1-acyl-sn-glycerol-3-phosphate acyltransferase
MKEVHLARKAYRAAGFGGLTAIAGAGILLDMAVSDDSVHRPQIRDKFTESWSLGLLKLFDVKMVTAGTAGVRGVGRDRGRIVVSNHRSIIDIGVMLALFGGAVLSRGDLAHWPIIGPAAKAAGTIFVDRSSKSSGAKAIRQMVERLDEKDTICLFPEGTTYEDDEVHEFKLGAFVAAKRGKVPVTPVGLVYPLDSGAAFGGETFMQHLGRLANSSGTRVWVEIGEPMELAEGEDARAFGERCRQEVVRLVGIGRAKEQASRKSS